MRLMLAALCIATCTSMASAQTQSEKNNRRTLSTALAVLCCLMTVKDNYGRRA